MRTIAFIALLLSALFLISCSRKPSDAPSAKPQPQPSTAEETAARAEKRRMWLLQASGIFAPTTPKSFVIDRLGKPDTQLADTLVYQLSLQHTGRVRSVRFIFNQSSTVEKVEYLDINGDAINTSATPTR